jgi:hypothetical protein
MRGVDLQRSEQARGVLCELRDRERPHHATALTDAAMVINERLKVLTQQP